MIFSGVSQSETPLFCIGVPDLNWSSSNPAPDFANAGRPLRAAYMPAISGIPGTDGPPLALPQGEREHLSPERPRENMG